MSKLTSAIDAKSLVIGVLLTVVVFMSMGANMLATSGKYRPAMNPTSGSKYAFDTQTGIYYNAKSQELLPRLPALVEEDEKFKARQKEIWSQKR
jgi:hypothetical protein